MSLTNIEPGRPAPTGSPRIAPTSDRGRRTGTFVLLVVLLGLALAVSGLPSPLYGTYAADWQLSPLTLTVVFAVYAVAALAAILVTGPVTDVVGRKPALLVSAAGMLVGLVVFMTAGGVAALIVARIIHGLSIGTAVVAGGAALLDIRPDTGARSGKITGIAFNLGMFAGIFGCALLAQLLPHPLVTPYAVVAVLTAVLLAALTLMPETHTARIRGRVQLARPSVPVAIRSDFWFAATGAGASWVLLGVYLSLVPGLAAAETGRYQLVFTGGVVAAFALASAAAQIVAGGLGAARTAIVGDVGLALSLLVSIPLLLTHSVTGSMIGSALVGVFFGMAFSGSLRHLSHVIPPAQRGSVMSAFYLTSYTAMAVPAVLAGAAATVWSLPATYVGFAIAVAVSCAAATILGARSMLASASTANAAS